MIKVWVYDLCPIFRTGLVDVLKRMPDVSMVREISSSQKVQELFQTESPDVVCLDLDDAVNALNLLSFIKEKHSKTRCVMFITDGQQPQLPSAIRQQADGFICKRETAEKIQELLTGAFHDEMVISAELTASLAVSLRNSPLIDESRDVALLTGREHDVLLCMAAGASNSAVSEQLQISEGTVKVHVKHILKKLNFSTRLEAAIWANQQGLLNG